ncbi:MAG: tetratricopeptide repeat protein [Verrucomicrobiota bacterium]|nr:tetratricopeptide repeat protein [Verrucomicrobiota bacterium]
MKRFSSITTLVLSLGLLFTAQAAGPDDSFIQAYTLIAQADNLSRLGQKNSAIQKYRQAHNDLAALQSGYPNWNAGVVSFRIKYVDQKLKALGDEAPETAAPSAKPAVLDPAAARREISILKRKVESLENAIILKDAKLKEALSAVPSPEETQQLATLEANLSELRQENANLKSAIDKATARLKDSNTGLAKAKADAEKAQADLAKAQAETEKTNEALDQAVEEAKTAKAKANDRQAKRLENELADKQENLAKAEKELASLATAHKALESELKSFKKGSREKDLQAQVGSLQKELSGIQKDLEKASGDVAALKSDKISLESELKSFKKGSREKDLQAQVESLQKELSGNQKDLEKASGNVAALKSDKISLEEELKLFKKGNREKELEAEVGSLKKQLTNSNSKLKETASNLASAENSNDSLGDQLKALQKGSREKEFTNYISSLEKRLAKAERKNTNPASKRKGLTGIFNLQKSDRAEKAQAAELQNRIDTLRSRLEILEAEKIPYTDEEKKLFAEPNTGDQPVNTLQAKVATLPEGAADDFKAGQAALIEAKFGEAEQKFLHVLKLDEENPLTLGNLALAQMEQGNYEGAEASLTRALKNDDADTFSLSLIGTLRYRQKKYDEARDYLAKAVKLNPEDSRAQHFLGSALNNLGQRKAAETALRKAVQIKPGYSEAHHNLAVVYATQNPPFIALAKFHYDKAVAGGHKKNADLEKILNGGD